MAINIESIYQNTYEHYLQAKSNIIEKGRCLNIELMLFLM